VNAPDDERRRRILSSDTRWRLRFAILAVVVPVVLFVLFRRQELRLRALADHGLRGTAVVTAVGHQNHPITYYRYEVAGTSYTWNVGREDAPYEPGESFDIVYLPEDPSLNRPGATYTPELFAVDVNLTFQRGLLLGLFAFFAGASALCHRNLRRLEGGAPLRTKPRMSPDEAGRVVAVMLLAVTLSVNFDERVQAVFAAVFGAAPLGVPVVAAVSAVEIVLAAPFFWVFAHLMRIVMAAQHEGGTMSRLGVAAAVVGAKGDLRRSRAVVLGGLVYFLALVAGWIALAASRGV
jgi:hypothetical protein